MKILAFAASNSSQSINRRLVEFSIAQLQASSDNAHHIELLDLNDFEMPIYSPDRERETGIPAPANLFFEKIGAADAIVVSFAEYNGSVTAAWKNIFDWMSRIEQKIWQEKPIVILAASPGGRAGQGVLAYNTMITPRFGGDLRGSAGFGPWSKVWDDDARTLTDPSDLERLNTALAALLQ